MKVKNNKIIWIINDAFLRPRFFVIFLITENITKAMPHGEKIDPATEIINTINAYKIMEKISEP